MDLSHLDSSWIDHRGQSRFPVRAVFYGMVSIELLSGTGNLTMRLLPVAREVVALDVDARMVNEVKKRAVSNGYMNLAVRQGDALRSDLGTFDVCAANLPYQISSHFLLRLLAHRPPFRCAPRLSCLRSRSESPAEEAGGGAVEILQCVGVRAGAVLGHVQGVALVD